MKKLCGIINTFVPHAGSILMIDGLLQGIRTQEEVAEEFMYV